MAPRPTFHPDISLQSAMESALLRTTRAAGNQAGWSRAVLDALPAAIYTTDAAGRVTYYNEAAARLAGHRPSLYDQQWCVSWRLYWPDGTPLSHDQCPMAIALKENRAVRGSEAILERPDGTRITFIPYPTPLRDRAGNLIGAVNMLVDISDRKTAEDARAYLAAIVDSSDDAIVSKDLNGIVKSWNRGAERIFGYSAAEMVGRSITTIIPLDRLPEEQMVLDRLRRGLRIENFETVRQCKDGRYIDVSLTISPVRDAAGRIIGASKIARDITERKRSEALLRDLNQNLEKRIAERTRELCEANNRLMAEAAERERSEAALRQAQRMEAVGQLAAGLAHDFNNLLAAVQGNLELIERRISDQRVLKWAQSAMRAVQRGAQLNRQILAFSRKQHLAPKPVDLNSLISGFEDMLGRTLGGKVEVRTALSADLWPALVDPHQLEIALLNLTVNARDAMPLGGRLLISTHNVKASELDRDIDLGPGDYVVISVSDTGIGMSDEVLARACDPFYTTKAVGKGSGLGLSQVYGSARQSGGGLKIKSAVGMGTTVSIYLPRSLAEAEIAFGHGDRRRNKPDAARSTILVVDDDDDVRAATVGLLEELGYAIVQAADAGIARNLLESGARIDLLLVDYAMPGQNGLDLALNARSKRPSLPVIIATGYVDVERLTAAEAEFMVLKKPYGLEELAAAVESSLARGFDTARSNVVRLAAAVS